ncbi:MAG: hypothetical protein JRF07_00335 [Deltaproteobacteria bacterium]|jgi:hypothetical protein|nr:hypothetical protein [Deltaproteobacteria bacterium]
MQEIISHLSLEVETSQDVTDLGQRLLLIAVLFFNLLFGWEATSTILFRSLDEQQIEWDKEAPYQYF